MYVLTGKSSIGFGMRSICKSDKISEEEFKALPERIKQYFEKVDEAKQTEPKSGKISIADKDNPDQVKQITLAAATPEEKEAIKQDASDNFRTTLKKHKQRK